MDAVLLLARHARSRGGVGAPGRGVVGGGGEGVGRARGRGRRGGRTSARPADVIAPGASLRVRTGPAPGARWESGRGGAAPARPRLPVSVLGRSVAGASASLDPRCAGPQPARLPEAGLARPPPPSQTVPARSRRTDPPRTALGAAWPGTAPWAWPRVHGELCPVRSPGTLGGAGSASQGGERRRHGGSTSGGRGSWMAQGLETWTHGAGTGQSAHAGVEPRGCGESWRTAALRDSRSAVSGQHLRTRQAPL